MTDLSRGLDGDGRQEASKAKRAGIEGSSDSAIGVMTDDPIVVDDIVISIDAVISRPLSD